MFDKKQMFKTVSLFYNRGPNERTWTALAYTQSVLSACACLRVYLCGARRQVFARRQVYWVSGIFFFLLCLFIATPALGYDDISLIFTWTAASGGPDHYNVYISIDDDEYTLVDTTPTNSYTLKCEYGHSYRIKVEAVDAAGNVGPMSEESDLVSCGTTPASVDFEEDDAKVSIVRLPEKTALLQSYPNPANPGAWIPYQLHKEAKVSIRIYDILGRLIKKIDLGLKSAGYYVKRNKAAYWDGKNDAGQKVAVGIYFYRIITEHIDSTFTAVRKMMVLK